MNLINRKGRIKTSRKKDYFNDQSYWFNWCDQNMSEMIFDSNVEANQELNKYTNVKVPEVFKISWYATAVGAATIKKVLGQS